MDPHARKASGLSQVFWFALALLIIGLVVFWPFMGKTRPRGREMPLATSHSEDLAARNASQAAAEVLARTAAESVRAAIEHRWDDLKAHAQEAVNIGPDRVRAYVWTLFTAFDSVQTKDQQQALRAFFDSGCDVRFGNRFEIGRGGWLTGWPTLRVALFDYLSQRNAAMAREIAAKILKKRPEEPGEWTLALRDLARGKPASEWTPEFRTILWKFIYDPEWAKQGRPSWLEGFDIVVAGHSAQFLENLAEVANSGVSRAAQFAAFLAADRMMLVDPVPTLKTLNDETYLLADATGMRAGIFARADVREPAQLKEIERYLLREDVGAGERSHFLSLYPHYNPVVSPKLLTQPPVRSMADMQDNLRAALAQINVWLKDDRFTAWHGALIEVAARLKQQIEG